MGSGMPKVEIAKLGWLWFTNPSMRSSEVDICIYTAPETDIGWISSVKVSISYYGNLIGEVSQEDTFILSEEHDDRYDICLKGFEIRDMIVFKKFIQSIMPNAKHEAQLYYKEPTAALQVIEEGHKLAVAIDLSGTGSLQTTVDTIKRIGPLIEIGIKISNKPHVEIWFKEVKFVLEKDGYNLAFLTGSFDIEAAGGYSMNYTFEGELSPDKELSGKAQLKGYHLKDNKNTWFTHALREFEIEVNLDEAVVLPETKQSGRGRPLW